MADEKISALTAMVSTDLDSSDYFPIVDATGPTTKRTTLSSLTTYQKTAGCGRWTTLSTSVYTATPATTSQITTTDLRTTVYKGMPLKYAYGGTTYYGIATAVEAAYIDVAGATLDTGTALTSLAYGTPEMAVTLQWYIAGDYDAGVANLLSAYKWKQRAGYLVQYCAKHITDDTGAAQPTLNLLAGGSAVGTQATNLGITMATTWTTNTNIAISTSNYSIDYDDEIVPKVTGAGTNGDATGLSVCAIVVLP